MAEAVPFPSRAFPIAPFPLAIQKRHQLQKRRTGVSALLVFRGQRTPAFGQDGPGFLVGLVFVAVLFQWLHGEKHEAGFALGAEDDGGGDEIPDILRDYPSTPYEARFADFIFRSGQAPAAKRSICWTV